MHTRYVKLAHRQGRASHSRGEKAPYARLEERHDFFVKLETNQEFSSIRRSVALAVPSSRLMRALPTYFLYCTRCVLGPLSLDASGQFHSASMQSDRSEEPLAGFSAFFDKPKSTVLGGEMMLHELRQQLGHGQQMLAALVVVGTTVRSPWLMDVYMSRKSRDDLLGHTAQVCHIVQQTGSPRLVKWPLRSDAWTFKSTSSSALLFSHVGTVQQDLQRLSRFVISCPACALVVASHVCAGAPDAGFLLHMQANCLKKAA